jgi:hypothetical protein
MVLAVGGFRVMRSESGLPLPLMAGIGAAAEMRATIGGRLKRNGFVALTCPGPARVRQRRAAAHTRFTCTGDEDPWLHGHRP